MFKSITKSFSKISPDFLLKSKQPEVKYRSTLLRLFGSYCIASSFSLYYMRSYLNDAYIIAGVQWVALLTFNFYAKRRASSIKLIKNKNMCEITTYYPLSGKTNITGVDLSGCKKGTLANFTFIKAANRLYFYDVRDLINKNEFNKAIKS